MKDLMAEMNKIKSKKFYSSYSQTITTFNNINNEVMNKITQTDETSFVSKRQMFTQTIETTPTLCIEQPVQAHEQNLNKAKVITSHIISRYSTNLDRLTGTDCNTSLHLVTKKPNVEKDLSSKEDKKKLTRKSYANINLNYEKVDYDNYFNCKKCILKSKFSNIIFIFFSIFSVRSRKYATRKDEVNQKETCHFLRKQ